VNKNFAVIWILNVPKRGQKGPSVKGLVPSLGLSRGSESLRGGAWWEIFKCLGIVGPWSYSFILSLSLSSGDKVDGFASHRPRKNGANQSWTGTFKSVSQNNPFLFIS
jgi:hypothetical protein